MKKRKLGLLISSVVAASAVLAACGDDNGGSDKDNFSIAMVTDVGGVDDKSFNESAWNGVKEWGKAQKLTKGDNGYDYLTSKTDADYIANLNSLVRRDFDLVFGIGFLMEDSIKEISSEQSDKYFAIIDSVVDADNVASVLFKEQEGAFLVGVVAATMSKTGTIGFVGGMEIPVIHRFEAGFVEGAKAVNPNIDIKVNYTGVFDDAAKGKIAANGMYSAGADIVFHAAGATGNGVFAEAKERKAKDANANVWVVGVDADQYAEGQVDTSTNITLTSMLKGVDKAVIDISDKAKAGKFPGGETITYGLAEDGVGLADSRGAIPEDVMKIVEEYKAKIASGEITVSESVR